MLTRRATRWVMVLAALACASVRADDAVKVSGDLKKMQGTWVNADSDGLELRWVITGETLKANVSSRGDYSCAWRSTPRRPRSRRSTSP